MGTATQGGVAKAFAQVYSVANKAGQHSVLRLIRMECRHGPTIGHPEEVGGNGGDGLPTFGREQHLLHPSLDIGTHSLLLPHIMTNHCFLL